MGKEHFIIKLILTVAIIHSCINARGLKACESQPISDSVYSIHKEMIIVDAHNHNFCLYQGDQNEQNQMTIQAVVAGHLDVIGHFFAYYPLEKITLVQQVKKDLKKLNNCLIQNSSRAIIATELEKIRSYVRQNQKVIIPGVEFFYGTFNNDISVVDSLYRMGIRVFTLMDNQYDQLSKRAQGDTPDLNDFGKALIRRMNALGMVIDISHLNDNMQTRVIDYSASPVIASHSSVRGVQKTDRNIPDDILRQLAKKNGIIMISFNSGSLAGVKEGRTEISELIRHIDHAVEVAGIDHVGIGSDFNGAGLRSPKGLETAAGFPNITRCLIEAGYSDEETSKILGENYLSLLAEIAQKSK